MYLNWKVSKDSWLFVKQPVFLVLTIVIHIWSVSSSISDFCLNTLNQSEPLSKTPLLFTSQSVLTLVWRYVEWNLLHFCRVHAEVMSLSRIQWSPHLWETRSYVKWFVIWNISLCGFSLYFNQQVIYLSGILFQYFHCLLSFVSELNRFIL